MCIGLPMHVLSLSPGFAHVLGRGTCRRVSTALIDPPAVGDWLLVFLDTAREHLDPARAAEINATLDMVEASLRAQPAPAEAGFVLPSSMSADQLAAFAAPPQSREIET
jgi:hydrogenase expression/formation protein HypC